MTKVLIIEKNGTIRESKMADFNELYKKCRFKKKEGFIKIHSWIKEKTDIIFNLYGRISGKKNSLSEYIFTDFGEDKKVYGTCAIVAEKLIFIKEKQEKQEKQEFINICLIDWENLFKNTQKIIEEKAPKEIKKRGKEKTITEPIKTKDKVNNIISDNTNNKIDDDGDNIDTLKDNEDDEDDDDDDNNEEDDDENNEELDLAFDNLDINDDECDENKKKLKSEKSNLSLEAAYNNDIDDNPDNDNFNYGSELSEDVYVYSDDE